MDQSTVPTDMWVGPPFQKDRRCTDNGFLLRWEYHGACDTSHGSDITGLGPLECRDRVEGRADGQGLHRPRPTEKYDDHRRGWMMTTLNTESAGLYVGVSDIRTGRSQHSNQNIFREPLSCITLDRVAGTEREKEAPIANSSVRGVG